MYTVRLVEKRLDQLGVDHTHQIVQALVGIWNAAEQGHPAFSQIVQMQFIGHGQPGNLRQVEGSKPDPDTHQDGLCGFARNELSRTFCETLILNYLPQLAPKKL